jgi:hypothetical protein
MAYQIYLNKKKVRKGMFIAYYRKILICEYILEPSTYCMSLILDSHETIPVGDLEHMITSLLSRRADKGFRVNSMVLCPTLAYSGKKNVCVRTPMFSCFEFHFLQY